ncbi:hypothetical protein T484DRAFT_2082582 [Baffinella frigidus]|nr:hypothetical protein T484DRAFT_2082582 [Cryptophyta sp. CCMP2293]
MSALPTVGAGVFGEAYGPAAEHRKLVMLHPRLMAHEIMISEETALLSAQVVLDALVKTAQPRRPSAAIGCAIASSGNSSTRMLLGSKGGPRVRAPASIVQVRHIEVGTPDSGDSAARWLAGRGVAGVGGGVEGVLFGGWMGKAGGEGAAKMVMRKKRVVALEAGVGEAKQVVAQTLNLKSENRNPKHETRNLIPETRNPEPEIRNLIPEARNPEPETRK